MKAKQSKAKIKKDFMAFCIFRALDHNEDMEMSDIVGEKGQ